MHRSEAVSKLFLNLKLLLSSTVGVVSLKLLANKRESVPRYQNLSEKSKNELMKTRAKKNMKGGVKGSLETGQNLQALQMA